MINKFRNCLGRRQFLAASVGFLATPALSQTTQTPDADETVELEGEISSAVRRNISSFRSYEWQPYFKNLKNGAILVDITSYMAIEVTIRTFFCTKGPVHIYSNFFTFI